MDLLTVDDGVTFPALDLGLSQTPPGESRGTVTQGLKAGCRHIDTAEAYGVERQVGPAVATGVLDRSEV